MILGLFLTIGFSYVYSKRYKLPANAAIAICLGEKNSLNQKAPHVFIIIPLTAFYHTNKHQRTVRNSITAVDF